MHIISLYLVLHVCDAIFDVMCVKKIEATKRGLRAAVFRSKFWSAKILCSISFVFGNNCPTID
jgi:hypothetical protein